MIANSDKWIEEWNRCYEEGQYLHYKKFCEAYGKIPQNRDDFKKWFYKARTQEEITADEEAIAYYIRQGKYDKSKK